MRTVAPTTQYLGVRALAFSFCQITAIGCTAADDGAPPVVADHYEGMVWSHDGTISAQVYTPDVCFWRVAPALGCVHGSDHREISCREDGQDEGISTDNGATEVTFLASGEELQTSVPDYNGFVRIDASLAPDTMRVRGAAGEVVMALGREDRPVAEASGTYTVVYDGSTPTVTAEWSAADVADIACVSTISPDGVSRRCCAPDERSMVVETYGQIVGVGLSRYNLAADLTQPGVRLGRWQKHGTSLALE